MSLGFCTKRPSYNRPVTYLRGLKENYCFNANIYYNEKVEYMGKSHKR